MAERALILSADRWEMPDERTGEIRKGVSVWYVNDYREDTDTSVGFKPTKVSASPEMLEKLRHSQLPAVYELHYGSRPGKDNKPTLTLIDVGFVSSVDVFNVKPSVVPASKTAA